MYKLSRRKNLIPFAVLLIIGLVATVLLPPMFPEQVFEIPAFALFPAEIALVIMLSVFFFENATPAELIRVSFSMLAICMFAGACCNAHAPTSQTMPDATLLLNWVQLAAMNVTGLIATIALYQTKPGAVEARPSAKVPVREAAQTKTLELPPTEAAAAGSTHESADKFEVATGESAKEILSKLEDRFNNLESQRQAASAAQSNSLSLDSLFADENDAAATKQQEKPLNTDSLNALFGDEDEMEPIKPEAPAAKADTPVVAEPKIETPPVKEETPAPASVETPISEPTTFDIGLDDLDFMGGADTPAPTPAAAQPAPAAPPPAAKASDALFDESALGGDLDDIFSSLAPADAVQDFSASKLAEIKAEKPPAPEPAPTPAAAAQTDNKLFDDVSTDLDDIFKTLAPEEAQKEVGDMLEMVGDIATPTPPVEVKQPAPAAAATAAAVPAPAAQAPNAKPREVKEFGRLSVGATAKTELAAPGTLKTIGQMLLDTHAIENIIRRTEGKDSAPNAASAATAKVVSVSRGADIQIMLNRICSYPGVDGCLVIGKDGLLIGATDSLGFMRDVLGVLALGIHSTTNLGTKKVDLGELRQSVMRTGEKLTVLTEIGIGVLATFSDHWNLSAIDGMIEHIAKVVNDSQASGGAALPMETLSGGLLASEPAPIAAPEPPPPPPPPAPEPVQAEAVIPITEAQGGLLNVTDDDLGGLFDNVLAESGKHNDGIGSSAPAAAPAAAASGNGSEPSLMSVSDDDMTDLFDTLLEKSDAPVDLSMDFSPESEPVAPAAAPVVEPPKTTPAAPVVQPAAPPVQPAPAAASAGGAQEVKKVKEFGRLSAQAITQQGSTDGAIKAIGRQLIDVQAVENIIKSGEKREKMGAGLTTARVISAARGEGIKALLTKIDGANGVVGSLIVGNDGLVIASTLQGGLDKDLLGALCTAMHSHTDLAAKKLQMGKLRQIIFHCGGKLTILTGVAVGVLAVFVEDHQQTNIDTLLNAIESTVRG